MIKPQMLFTYNGKPAKTLSYFPYLNLWLCRYDGLSTVFYLFPEEIEKSRKEADKDMKLEYKFYEKNLAPKWLEGDYDLHIEGNRMTMTSKDGKKVEARCHPEDDWRLQVGIDELKERMNEVKKLREIKVGDKVKFKKDEVDWYVPHTIPDWTNRVNLPNKYIFEAYRTIEIYSPYIDEENGLKDLENINFYVMCLGKSVRFDDSYAYIHNEAIGIGFIVNTKWLELAE